MGWRFVPVVVFAGWLAACEVPGNFSETDTAEDSLTPGFAVRKVSLRTATADELANYIVDCHGSPHQVCVLICHRPPGNPENSRSRILPLKASLKHLVHGDPSREEDYLGTCDEDRGEIPEENDSGDLEDGNDVDDGSADLPEWCRQNAEVDADCDGIDDRSGEPLY